MPRGGARRKKLVHVQNKVFLCQSFLEVHILTNTYQKPFILRTKVPCRVDFHSITSDPRVHAGRELEVKSSASSKCGFSASKFPFP